MCVGGADTCLGSVIGLPWVGDCLLVSDCLLPKCRGESVVGILQFCHCIFKLMVLISV